VADNYLRFVEVYTAAARAYCYATLVDRALQQDNRPGDQIASLQRYPYRLPTLRAKLIEAVWPQIGGLLERSGVFQRDNQVLPFLHPRRMDPVIGFVNQGSRRPFGVASAPIAGEMGTCV
jgi:hypothetical protein